MPASSSSRSSFELAILAPLYNEEEVVSETLRRLDAVLDSMAQPTEVILVDDGSSDSTPLILQQKALADSRYQCVLLSRNFGHTLALSAGMSVIRATEALFIIDGDLQDPPELLPTFLKKFREGYDVVYGIRRQRKEGPLKRTAYHMAYRMIRAFASLDLPPDSGDFALVSRRVTDLMNAMPESSRYLRGMRAWVGFKQTGIEYERSARMAGETKYSLNALIRLAFKGIINFSELPVRFITWAGGLSVTLALVYLIYTVLRQWLYHDVPSGFTALVALSVLFHGVTLLSIGLIGEYILRIFMQQKGRPLFVVRTHVRDGMPVSDSHFNHPSPSS